MDNSTARIKLRLNFLPRLMKITIHDLKINQYNVYYDKIKTFPFYLYEEIMDKVL